MGHTGGVATDERSRRATLLPEIEGLKRDQNAAGEEVGKAKREGRDTTALQEANKVRAQQIKQLGAELEAIEQALREGCSPPGQPGRFGQRNAVAAGLLRCGVKANTSADVLARMEEAAGRKIDWSLYAGQRVALDAPAPRFDPPFIPPDDVPVERAAAACVAGGAAASVVTIRGAGGSISGVRLPSAVVDPGRLVRRPTTARSRAPCQAGVGG